MKLLRLSRLGKVCGLLSMLILASCGALTNSSAPANNGHAGFCDVAAPIYWADGDTDTTIAAIKEHNAVWVKLCTAAV